MKLLIITGEIKNSSPVLPFIKALDRNKSINLTVFAISPSIKVDVKNSKVLFFNPKIKLDQRITKLVLILMGRFIVYPGFRSFCINNAKRKNFEAVLAFTASSSQFSISIANHIAGKNKKTNFLIHTVDPLPSIKAWGEKNIYRKANINFFKENTKTLDFLSANNDKMLKYQKQFLRKEVQTDVLYTINSVQFKTLEREKTGKKVFLYLGSFYGKRKPNIIIDAFNAVLMTNPNCELWFAGNHTYESLNITKKDKNIKLLGFVNNIDAVIAKVDILIDIDADIKNDVFVSGKIVKYLSYNRIIMSITPFNSPTSLWLDNTKNSVVISDHLLSNVKQAMLNAITLSEALDNDQIYYDRAKLLKKFNADNVLKTFYKALD